MWKKAGILLLFCAGLVHAQSIELVKDGKPVSEIVIADKPTRDAQFAAWELQHHIKLITGAELPIRTDSQKAQHPVALSVGSNEKNAKLGFKSENYKGEEYELKFEKDAVVMIGREHQDFGKLDFTNFRGVPLESRPEHGTLWAAYEFLEKCCGVRWYGPADAGIAYTPRKTLTVAPVHVRRAPTMQGFRQLYLPGTENVLKNFYRSAVPPLTRVDLNIFAMRWRMVKRYGYGSHNVASLYFAYWDESTDPWVRKHNYFKERRPEYFAQGCEGQNHLNSMKRFFPKNSYVPPAICQTHPDVFKHYAKEAVDARKGIYAPIGHARWEWSRTPRLEGVPFYYPFENDDNDALCRCPRCEKAFADKDAKKRPSYLHFNWANEIAKEAKKLDPNVNIVTLAYGSHQHYPHGLELSDNLGVQMVLHCASWYHPMYRNKEMSIFNDWTADSKAGKRMVSLWTHYLSPYWDAIVMRNEKGYFPVFFYKEIGRFFKTCADRKVDGWFGQVPLEGYFMTVQLESYISAMLAFDAGRDVDQLVDEYFTGWYGSAGAPMKKFYELIRTASQDPQNYPKEYSDPEAFAKSKHQHNYQKEDVNWGMLGTRERMNELAKYVDEARHLIKTPQEKLHFEIFLKALWEPMQTCRAAYEKKTQFLSRMNAAKLTIPRIPSAGGDPAKADWSKAVVVDHFKTVQGFPGKRNRSMKLAHDGEYLYFRFDETCKSGDLKTADNVFSGDEVELFFAGKRKKPYLQFAVNPAGKTFSHGYFSTEDAAFDGPWDFEEKGEAVKTADGFSLQYAFPLEKLHPEKPYKPGDSFFMNVFRAKSGKTAHCWSPTFSNNFHEISRLGKITLAK